MDSETGSSNSQAPERPLPQIPFYSIEYPGYVQASSVPLAIRNLGGQAKLDHAFRRSTQKADALLELSMQPENPFSHPIPGDVIGANNLLLKVVKRRRKTRPDADVSGSSTSADGSMGDYTAEICGIVAKTGRFRSAYAPLRSHSSVLVADPASM